MKYALALSLFAATVLAQPHGHHHQHRQLHEKRDETVWVTDWVYVTEVVDLTTTVYVDENGSTLSGGGTEASTVSVVEPSTSSGSATGGNFFQGASSSSSTFATPTPTTTLTTSSSTEAATSSPSTTSLVEETSTYVPPAPESTSTSSSSSSLVDDFVPSSTLKASSVYVAPTTSSVAAATSSAASSSGGSTGAASTGCSVDSPCTGNMTYYEAGLGACGVTNDGTTDDIVAVGSALMGSLSNNNPLCGQSLTISYGGNEVTVTVEDKCPGCQGYNSLDLSEHAFKQLADESVGIFEATWWFN